MPPGILPKGIRAVATLLECEETMRTAEVVAATVMHKIDPALESLEKAADQTQGTASDTRTVADHMYRTGEETRDELQKGAEVASEEIQRATECLETEVSKLIENAVTVLNEMSGLGRQQEDRGPARATYANALNR